MTAYNRTKHVAELHMGRKTNIINLAQGHWLDYVLIMYCVE